MKDQKTEEYMECVRVLVAKHESGDWSKDNEQQLRAVLHLLLRKLGVKDIDKYLILPTSS